MKFLKLLVLALTVFITSFLIVFFSFALSDDKTNLDLLLTNAIIIDGTGGEPYRAEIGIKGNKIMVIGENLPAKNTVIYNLAGYTVAPDKVDWLAHQEWVSRDLPTAILRYPLERLVVEESPNPDWENKSIADLCEQGLTFPEMQKETRTRVKIIPKFDYETKDLATGFYNLSGMRTEILGLNYGKIEVGYEARLIVYNHRQFTEDIVLKSLQNSKLPPIKYLIKGSKIQ